MGGDQARGAPLTTGPVRLAPAQLRPLARLRARLTVAKSAALFLLPLPLLLVIGSALVGDDSQRLLLAAGALACVWTAGLLTWRGLVREMRYVLGEAIELDRIPRKMSGAVLTAGGAALTALAAGHNTAGAITLATVGGLGHLCFYGLDMRANRLTVTPVDGLDVADVTQQLEQADLRLRRIDAAARAIAVPEFQSRLARITTTGREILAAIAEDPRRATRARRFLSLFLDSAERITGDYARTHPGMRTGTLETNFRELLTDMDRTFSEQHRRLLESDVVSLDVEMEVLNARLKQERARTPLEKGL